MMYFTLFYIVAGIIVELIIYWCEYPINLKEEITELGDFLVIIVSPILIWPLIVFWWIIYKSRNWKLWKILNKLFCDLFNYFSSFNKNMSQSKFIEWVKK